MDVAPPPPHETGSPVELDDESTRALDTQESLLATTEFAAPPFLVSDTNTEPEINTPDLTDSPANTPDREHEAAPGSQEGIRLLETIAAALDSFHTRTEQYENTNRLLHSRIEDLQNDQVRSLLKPVFERLATMHAQASEAATSMRDRDPSSASDFEFFAISINELLALYDVEPVGAVAGAAFNSKDHHGARTVPTCDADLEGKIQRVQRQGYRFAGADRVMLPARVSVYRYTPPVEQQTLEATSPEASAN